MSNPNASDPDLNIQSFNDHGIYTMEELTQLSSIVKPQFSMFHVNTRSLNQHFEDFLHLIETFPFNPEFVGCSETWFQSSTDFERFKLPNYVMINEYRASSTGGGVTLYVKSDSQNFQLRNDLKLDGIENIWIETQNMIVGLLYKPPNFSNCQFLDELEESLHKVYLSKKKCIMMGDINIKRQSA